jgi:transcriptional regulator with XRE-family HTH domain
MRWPGALRERHRQLSALGQAVREARERQGMTRTEFARRAGVSRWWVWAIEAGWLDPHYFGLWDIRDALGVSLTVLLRRAETIEACAQGRGLVLWRVLVCALVFAGATVALASVGGLPYAAGGAAVVAFAVNHYWRAWQLRRLHRELREAIERERRDG